MVLTNQKIVAGWVGALAALAMGGVMFAQSPVISSATPTASPTPSDSGTSATLADFEQEQQTLAQEWQTLLSQGATQQQLDDWAQQNATELQSQSQLAQTLAAQAVAQPLQVLDQVIIPEGASNTLADFLTGQATLANARAQIYNQLLQSAPGATQQQIDQETDQTFERQNAAQLQAQSQQAQALAAEVAPQPLPEVTPPIPPNATPQLAAYLTARNALMQSWVQVWNQNVNSDSGTRQAAIQQWQQQNASQISQLQQLAAALSASTSTQQVQAQ